MARRRHESNGGQRIEDCLGRKVHRRDDVFGENAENAILSIFTALIVVDEFDFWNFQRTRLPGEHVHLELIVSGKMSGHFHGADFDVPLRLVRNDQ